MSSLSTPFPVRCWFAYWEILTEYTSDAELIEAKRQEVKDFFSSLAEVGEMAKHRTNPTSGHANETKPPLECCKDVSPQIREGRILQSSDKEAEPLESCEHLTTNITQSSDNEQNSIVIAQLWDRYGMN